LTLPGNKFRPNWRFRTLLGPVLALALCGAALAQTSADPAALISDFRAQHHEGRVKSDATLKRIAQDQANAMASKAVMDHDVLGPFNRRVAPANAGRAAENIAYGYESFEKTLGQWIDSSEHRKNLLLARATRVGIASAKDASGKRTYWAMEIAGDYEPKTRRRGKDREPLVAVKRDTPRAVARAKPADCHIRLLGLCL